MTQSDFLCCHSQDMEWATCDCVFGDINPSVCSASQDSSVLIVFWLMTTRTLQPLTHCVTALNYGALNKCALYCIVLYCNLTVFDVNCCQWSWTGRWRNWCCQFWCGVYDSLWILPGDVWWTHNWATSGLYSCMTVSFVWLFSTCCSCMLVCRSVYVILSVKIGT